MLQEIVQLSRPTKLKKETSKKKNEPSRSHSALQASYLSLLLSLPLNLRKKKKGVPCTVVASVLPLPRWAKAYLMSSQFGGFQAELGHISGLTSAAKFPRLPRPCMSPSQLGKSQTAFRSREQLLASSTLGRFAPSSKGSCQTEFPEGPALETQTAFETLL